jgi:hypothetical protein
MRWERLFDDFESQLSAAEAAELEEEINDRLHRERGSLKLYDRLRYAVGTRLRFDIAGVGLIAGNVCDVGPDWLLMTGDGTEKYELLVATDAIIAVEGLGPRGTNPGSEGTVANRLRLGYALRVVARDRLPVVLSRTDGGRITGLIHGVYQDSLDVVEDRMAGYGNTVTRTIPLRAVATVRAGG